MSRRATQGAASGYDIGRRDDRRATEATAIRQTQRTCEAAEHFAVVAAACLHDSAPTTAWLDARKGELLTAGSLSGVAAFDRLAHRRPRPPRCGRPNPSASPAASSV